MANKKNFQFNKERFEGALNSLESMDDLETKVYKSKGVKEENNKTIKEQNNKKTDEEKSKRSFMLTHNQIKELYELKQEFINKDLSTMVGEAIDDYYNKNKRVKK